MASRFTAASHLNFKAQGAISYGILKLKQTKMSPANLLKVLFLLVIVTLNLSVFAQTKSDAWYTGEIELIDNHIYQVQLRYVPTRSEGLLQARENEALMTLSPLKIKSFEFFDSLRNEYRRFVSIPTFMENHQYQKKMFIEVLYPGNAVSLFRHTNSYGMMATEALYLMDHRTQEIFPYAVSKYSHRNKPVYINADTKLLFQLGRVHTKELKDYATRNHLRLRKLQDISALLTYLDQLSNISAKEISPLR